MREVMTMQFHPVCQEFRDMTVAEFANLKDDLAAEGQRVPILRWNGVIVDGRHRFKACLEIKKAPKFKEIKGTEEDMLRLVRSLNVSRRHLTSAEVAEHVERLLKQHPELNNAEIAKKAGTNTRKVKGARRKQRQNTSAEGGSNVPLPEVSNLGLSPRITPEISKLPKKGQLKFVELFKETNDAGKALETVKNLIATKQLDAAVAADRDEIGTPIPARIADVFKGDFVHATIVSLNHIIQGVKSASSFNPFLRPADIVEGLTRARNLLQPQHPYAVHAECKGEGCVDCKSAGWLPKWRYEELQLQAAQQNGN